MKTPTLHKSLKSGFSLVELLVVIAVIAIIAAIAIPNIAGITGSATASKNARNAQTAASAFNAARAAGYNATITTDTAALAAVNTSLSGADPSTNGIPVGFSFGGLALSAGDQTAATPYLRLANSGANSVLEYVADGSATP